MDENQTDEKEILRRQDLEEKRNTDQPEDSDSSVKEASSVFQSFANKSTNEKRTLFRSEEDSLPQLEVKEPASNSLFSSESVPAQNKSLFAYDRNIFDESDFAPEDQIVSKNNLYTPPSPVQNHSDTSFSDGDNFENEDPDAAFPLFLSFKANDSIKNVSEGVREKYPAPDDFAAMQNGEISSSSLLPENTEDPVQAVDMPSEEFDDYSKMLDAMDTPIFKPYSLPPENDEYYDDGPVYDIPQVFDDRNARDSVDKINNTDMTDPDEAYSPEYDHVPVRSRGVNSQMSGDPDPVVLTARPGTRYSAAQQMGNVAPAPKIRTQPRQTRAANRMPLVIILFTLAILVALFSVWSYFSDGNVLLSLFGSNANTNVTTAAATTFAAVIETAAETTVSVETTAETTQKPTPVPTSTPAPTQETTAAETTAAETTAATTAETTASGPAMIPSGFATTITNGSASGDAASFDINFKNSGGNDVSFYDGIEYITITFSTSGATIMDVTSDDFVFTANPDKRNTFIGTPVSKEVVAFRDTRTVTISAKSDGTSIGKYTIKYYVKCYS